MKDHRPRLAAFDLLAESKQPILNSLSRSSDEGDSRWLRTVEETAFRQPTTQNQIDLAQGNAETMLPEGLERPEEWE